MSNYSYTYSKPVSELHSFLPKGYWEQAYGELGDIIISDDLTGSFPPEEAERLTREWLEQELAAVEQFKDVLLPIPVYHTQPFTGERVELTFYIPRSFQPSWQADFHSTHQQMFNVYIPSYGRANQTRSTWHALDQWNFTYYVVVNPSQWKEYVEVLGVDKVIVRDPRFQLNCNVDTCSPVRAPAFMNGTAGLYNGLYAFARSIGEDAFWTLDDDIFGFGLKAPKQAKFGRAKYDRQNFYWCSKFKPEHHFDVRELFNDLSELFVKFDNVQMLALDKFGIKRTAPIKFSFGTRAFSCYLTSTKHPVEHKQQHNNDVGVSLDANDSGKPIVVFEGFTYASKDTQSGGGLTDTYMKFGTLDKGKVLCRKHPNVSSIIFFFSRVHHCLNLAPYVGKVRAVGAAAKS